MNFIASKDIGRLYIAYDEKLIAYQKKLSKLANADIYRLEVDRLQGCTAIERVFKDKLFIKELLVPEAALAVSLMKIANSFQAEEYIIRTPAFLGKQLAGDIRPFGMIRANGDIDLKITVEDMG